MMGAVTLVLLIACANVANLMLARASVRGSASSRCAPRSAPAAARMVRQLLTECVVLGLAAAPLGLAIAYMRRVAARRRHADRRPCRTPCTGSSTRAPSLYTTLVAALTGLVFGLAPALQAGRLNMVEALRDGSRGIRDRAVTRARLRNGLVVVEVGACSRPARRRLALRPQLRQPAGANTGFDTTPLLTMRFYMTGEGTRPTSRRCARGRHRAAHRGAARRRGGVRIEFHSARAGGGGGSDRDRWANRGPRRRAEHLVHRGDAAFLQNDGPSARQRAAISPTPRA